MPVVVRSIVFVLPFWYHGYSWNPTSFFPTFFYLTEISGESPSLPAWRYFVYDVQLLWSTGNWDQITALRVSHWRIRWGGPLVSLACSLGKSGSAIGFARLGTDFSWGGLLE